MFTCKSHFGENVQQSRRDKLWMPGRDCCLDGISVVVKSSVCRSSVIIWPGHFDFGENFGQVFKWAAYSSGGGTLQHRTTERSIGQCNAIG